VECEKKEKNLKEKGERGKIKAQLKGEINANGARMVCEGYISREGKNIAF
jgi:hypothetical protein